MSLLFTPNKLGPHQLDNRIIVAPMCLIFCARWNTHYLGIQMHYGQLALSGAALVIIEATAVEPRGRISYKDLGLWSDEEHGRALKQLISDIKQHTNAKIGIQLAGHAGRKASNIVASGKVENHWLLMMRMAGKSKRLLVLLLVNIISPKH